MGTYLVLCWNDSGKDKSQSVIKLYYPTQLNYSQSEIPDGRLPCDLDPKYLKNYRAWLEKILFVAEKMPEPFMELYRTASSDPYQTAIESIKSDISSIDDAMKKTAELKRFGLKPVLHVG